MRLTIRRHSQANDKAWDAFLETTFQATFLHTRRFLSYHEDRFDDCSLILEIDNKIVGVFPAAENLEDESEVISHPGITYGGILHGGELVGDSMVEAFSLIKGFYKDCGYKRLIYKVTPPFYHSRPTQDDLYAMHRHFATRTRCDLAIVIDLMNRRPQSERRRRGLKKAKKCEVLVVEGPQYTEALWGVIKTNLQVRYGRSPTHTLKELEFLVQEFPQKIKLFCGVVGSEVICGLVVFVTSTCFHLQYIAATEEGRKHSALDLVIEHVIDLARKSEDTIRWFSFGISTEQNGYFLNTSLDSYKREFGGSTFIHEFYTIEL